MTVQPASITVHDLADWQRQGQALALLDVREPWELDICRIEGALSIPLQQLPARAAELPTDRKLVVFCHHGGRSAQAVAWLRRAGLDQAVNLEGGIDSWAREIDRTMGTY